MPSFRISVHRFERKVGRADLPTPCLRVSWFLNYYHSSKLHSAISKMAQITCKLLILKVTAAGYALVLLPIFQTVRCQILEVCNINSIAE